ncbi:adenylate/guanylate cyclase domain-containing protein [Sulfurovum sp.]|uniref:CHASE2 domain-containing protein n=1 Tax=Sulfurovum sp. TaxID=1969726 RepID=UPI002867C00D|nr:adenylate/guanylate cyclase domain-containing protein [Sulfurovum sp.]
MSNSLVKYSIISTFALFLSWTYLYTPQSFFAINTHLNDFLFTLRGDLPKSKSIVIIDIDEESLEEFGQWPWSRSRVAKLIQTLSDAKSGTIGLDIVFAEADKTSPHSIAQKLNMNVKDLDNYDEILAKTFSSTPVIGGYFFRFDEGKHNKTPMIPTIFFERGIQNSNTILEAKSVVLNIDILQDELYSSGFFNNIPDPDGMIRSVPLVMRYKGSLYPSLALEMLRIYSNESGIEVIGDEIGIDKIKIGDYHIPTDHSARLQINYRGGGKHFDYISAKDILTGEFDPNEIEGKFVLIGTSAIALSDLRSIPLDSVIPGVEIQANILDNILVGDFIYKPFNQVLYDLIIIWLIIFVFAMIVSYLKSWLLLPVLVASCLLLYKFFLYLLFDQGMVVNLLFPILAFIGTLILTVTMDYLSTSRQKEFIKRTFAKKVSKAVMDDLINDKSKDLFVAREQEVAIFFSDIRGFTTIGEEIKSSQKLVALLNRYMTPMVDEISKLDGTVDKFIGDAIMAYWNAPKPVEKYADKALTSALKQIEVLHTLNDDLYNEFGVKLKIGIAIHVGKVTIGEMGSLDRSDYTIIGDNVNLASRIEGLNKLYGTKIIISEGTKNALQDTYTMRSLDIVKVRGKQESVEVFEVLCLGEGENLSDELDDYAHALKLYRSGEFHQAHAEFSALYSSYKSMLYRIYKERCQEQLESPEKVYAR